MTPHPREAPAVVGHDDAFAHLLRAWQGGRFPHARLIAGPRGVGKATLVYRLARRVFASEGSWSRIDHQVSAGEHPNLLALEPAEAGQGSQAVIKVDDVRRVSRFCAMGGAQGAWRIVVVDPAEALNAAAANALLKDLEEPTEGVLFFLVSHVPARVLATIRSRCVPVHLSPLPRDTAVQLVQRYQGDVALSDAELAVRIAGGAPGHALTLTSLGVPALYREMAELFGAMPNHDAPIVTDTADRFSADHATFTAMSQVMHTFVGSVVRCRATGEAPGEMAPTESAAISHLAGRGSLEDWLAVWDNLADIFGRVDQANLDRREVMLAALLAVEETTAAGSSSSRARRDQIGTFS